MFCPKCGAREQSVDTYCRQCGTFLPDFDSMAKRETPPEANLRANIVLSAITAIVSAIFGILLATDVLGPDYAARLVRAATIFLWCICIWQISIMLRSFKLIKQVGQRNANSDDSPITNELPAAATRSLKTADLSDVVPPSVVERTTRQLHNKTD